LTEHRLLTGASLHEPKGVETASAGQVYVSDGFGSGSWVSRNDGNFTLNRFVLQGLIPDVSETTSFYDTVTTKASLSKVYLTLGGTITGAPSVLTIYKNNIAQTPTLSVPFLGSGAGVSVSYNISPALIFNEGDIIRVGSDGGSTGSQNVAVSLSFTAIT